MAAPKIPNPCHGAKRQTVMVPSEWYGLRMDFAPSNAQLTRYCEHHRYKMVMKYDSESGVSAPTFDTNALDTLIERYPQDKLFPLIARYRMVEKCLGGYVDGLTLLTSPLGPQYGRVCGEFLHVPRTGRLSMKGAPHQLQPRTSDPLNPYYQVREMYVAPPGHRIMEFDFGGIEGVLTQYYTGVDAATGRPKPGREDARQGLRLSGIDIHGYISSFALEDGQHGADVSWSDSDLAAYFKQFRAENRQWRTRSGQMKLYEDIRDANKTGYYASLYGGGPSVLVQSQPSLFPNTMVAAEVQNLILGERFPSIRKWHWEECEAADRDGYLTTPDGYRQWFTDVIEHSWSKRENKWTHRLGKSAKECIAAKPQHTAMLYTGAAIGRFWDRYPDFRQYLRLTIHDSIVTVQPDEVTKDVAMALQSCMEEALPFLPLPLEWNMGSHLSIKAEGKWSAIGGNWREMSKIKWE